MQRKKKRRVSELDSTQDHASSSPAVTMVVVAETTRRESCSPQSVPPQGGSDTPTVPAPTSVSVETVSSRPAEVVAVVSSAPLLPQQQQEVPMPSGYGTSGGVGMAPQPSTREIEEEVESVTIREASSEDGIKLSQSTREQSTSAATEVALITSSEAEMRSGGLAVVLNEPSTVCHDNDKNMQVAPSYEAKSGGSDSVSRSSQLSVAGRFADSSEESLERVRSPRLASTDPAIKHTQDPAGQEVGVVEIAEDEEEEMEEGEMSSEEGEVERIEEVEEASEEEGGGTERRLDGLEEAIMEYADTTHVEGMCECSEVYHIALIRQCTYY